MHDNANIAFQLQETTSIYDTVLDLQPKVGGGGGEGEQTPEEKVDDFAATFEEQVWLSCSMHSPPSIFLRCSLHASC